MNFDVQLGSDNLLITQENPPAALTTTRRRFPITGNPSVLQFYVYCDSVPGQSCQFTLSNIRLSFQSDDDTEPEVPPQNAVLLNPAFQGGSISPWVVNDFNNAGVTRAISGNRM